jgi:LacI family transcriptional regulator
MTTVREIAKKCGVSTATVSHVLNNRTTEVSVETRERVMNVVRRLNYRPPAAKRQRSPARETVTVGIIRGTMTHDFVTPGYEMWVLNSIMRASLNSRINLTLFAPELFHTDVHESIRTYCDGSCDGLIMVSSEIDHPLPPALRERGIPLVLVGDSGVFKGTSFVDVDNEASIQLITEHVISQGHTRIAYCAGPQWIRCVPVRQEAWKLTMRQHGIPIVESFVGTNVHLTKDTMDWTTMLMEMPEDERPTAIIGWNDTCARLIMDIVKSMGMSVPKDVSVTGFDDDVEAVNVQYVLTTIRQPFPEIGKSAVDAILRGIRSNGTDIVHVVLPGELVIRTSLGRPPL